MAKQSDFVTELVREWEHACSFGSDKTYLENTLGELKKLRNIRENSVLEDFSFITSTCT